MLQKRKGRAASSARAEHQGGIPDGEYLRPEGGQDYSKGAAVPSRPPTWSAACILLGAMQTACCLSYLLV